MGGPTSTRRVGAAHRVDGLTRAFAMENALPPPEESPRRDLADITLDRLLGTARHGISLPPLEGSEPARLPFWTRAYLYMLGATAPIDESPKSLHDRLVDAVIVAVIVLLLVWIAFLTLRGWALYGLR